MIHGYLRGLFAGIWTGRNQINKVGGEIPVSTVNKWGVCLSGRKRGAGCHCVYAVYDRALWESLLAGPSQ